MHWVVRSDSHEAEVYPVSKCMNNFKNTGGMSETRRAVGPLKQPTKSSFITLGHDLPWFIFEVSKSCMSEKAMAPHSSTLAWRIPGTGEPGGLPSMGLHRVGHDWIDVAAAAARAVCNYIAPTEGNYFGFEISPLYTQLHSLGDKRDPCSISS